jgi:hypothetical protein
MEAMKDLIRSKPKKRAAVKLAGAFGLLLALSLILSLVAVPAMAFSYTPHQLYGAANISPCDIPVWAGAEVTAEIDGVVYDTTYVEADGTYGYLDDFKVPGDDPGTPDPEGGAPGDLIELFIEGELAGSVVFVSGGAGDGQFPPNPLDLEITDDDDPNGTISINGGATCTNSTSVTLSLTWDDGLHGCGVVQMRFSNDNTNWTGWEAVAATKAWTLTAGTGVKTVYVEFLDGANNNSNSEYTISDTITLDQTDPSGTININGGATCTNSTSVTLSLTWDDGAGCGVDEMRFSNDNTSWSAWEAVATTKAWTLTAGTGVRTVYVEFLDVAGNNSNSDYTISDTITLDTSDPTGTITINGGEASTESRNVTLSLTWNDGEGCGVVSMRFSNDNTSWSAWEAVSPTKAWTLTAGAGIKTVYVEFLDAAGWNSNSIGPISDTIELIPGTLVLINEFVSDPSAGQECIELYNPGDEAVDLTDWTIEDGGAVPDELDGLSVPAGGYLVLQQGTDFAFTLDDAGDTIILTDNTPAEVDRVAYGTYDDGNTADNAPAPGEGESTGRCPNGSDTDVDNVDFRVFASPTSGAANIVDPAVTTLDATEITDVSATLNGNLDDLGCPPEVDVSFVYGTSSGGPYPYETTPETMYATGPFSDGIDGLTPNTTYYFQAKAEGSIVYGGELSFTTLKGPPSMYIYLAEGWNTFSVPLSVAPDNTLGDLATMAGLNIKQAWYLYNDGVTAVWVAALAGYPMEPCDAILIEMNAPGAVPIYPDPTPTSSAKDVYNGWNMVGSAFLNETGELPVDEALISLYFATGELKPWGYTQVISPAYNQPYWVYTRQPEEGGETPPNMLVGKGYLVAMDNPDGYKGQTLTPWPGPWPVP